MSSRPAGLSEAGLGGGAMERFLLGGLSDTCSGTGRSEGRTTAVNAPFRRMGVAGTFLLLVLLTVPHPGWSATINEGLVAYYPFDGNADDLSGQGNHGTVSGAILAPDRFGSPAGAYRFRGQDFIRVASSTSLNLTGRLSIAVWLRMDNAGTNLSVGQYVLSKGTGPYFNASRNTYSLFLGNQLYSSPSLTFELSNGGLRHFTPDATALRVNGLDPAAWYHVVAVWDGTIMRLYLNGVSVPEADTTFLGPLNTTADALHIGRLGDGSSYFKGTMDELRIYGRALGPEEVQHLFFGRFNCDADASYTQEDLDAAYRHGYETGRAEALGELCSSFDWAAGRLHVPCLDLGTTDTFWLDLLILPTDPIQFQLEKFDLD